MLKSKKTNMKNQILTLTFLGSLAAMSSASAALIGQTTYNGHMYELYQDAGISWTAAQANATSAGGYLAVLTDATEIQTVYNSLIGAGFFQPVAGQSTEAWLGATPADGSFSTTSNLNWKWVTGEAWTADDAANFGAGEPNGDSTGLAINRYGNFQFNDEGGAVGGYIVEKNGVPDGGSTVAMLGAAMGAVAFVRRKVK
jgi:hypothetical protein